MLVSALERTLFNTSLSVQIHEFVPVESVSPLLPLSLVPSLGLYLHGSWVLLPLLALLWFSPLGISAL